jgi:hypothetical protein
MRMTLRGGQERDVVHDVRVLGGARERLVNRALRRRRRHGLGQSEKCPKLAQMFGQI